jgi:aspartyl-tRNA synthetase
MSYRTHTSQNIGLADAGKTITLAGFVETVRDHGGITFLDLRDFYGVTQVVLNDEIIKKLPPKESVIQVEGVLKGRSKETVNAKIPTGEVELFANKITVLSSAVNNLPFEVLNSLDIKEELRLKFRYLDLRNPKMRDKIVFRSKICTFLRREMENLGFLEIQTPILTSSSPEGARDYLVPSRKFKGKFYALPQAPQQFKQLLMASGFERYFQIAPCFRDEDARADRSPGEFYQLDFEMAYATQEDVFDVAEKVLYNTFKQFSKLQVSPPPFKKIPFAQSMLRYGTDKPDLRNPLVIEDLTAFFAEVDFAPFKNKPVRGIVAPACALQSKTFFEKMLTFAESIGMKGLGYISIGANFELKGPIVKFLHADRQKELIETLNLKENDTLFFVSDVAKLVNKFAGQIRTELGARLNIVDKTKHEFCFIVDFPMYEESEESGKIEFTHNPFSMPQGELDALLNKNPLDIKAYQYDIVVDGVELSSGAVRNHRPDIMLKAFEIAGYSKEVLEEKFAALFNAFHYGAPPHAGMAPGLDRIVMILLGEESIREVIAFPMNSNAQDLLLNAPSDVTEQQLRDVHIKIR